MKTKIFTNDSIIRLCDMGKFIQKNPTTKTSGIYRNDISVVISNHCIHNAADLKRIYKKPHCMYNAQKNSVEAYIEKLISKEGITDVVKESRFVEGLVYSKPSTYDIPYKERRSPSTLSRYDRIAWHCFKYLYSKTQSLQYLQLCSDVYSHTQGTLAEDCIQTAALAICEYKYSHRRDKSKGKRFIKIKHVGFSYLSKACYKKACNAVYKAIRTELPYKGRKKISTVHTVAENPCYIYRDGILTETYNSSKEVVLDIKSAYPLEFISLSSTLSKESDGEKIAMLEDNVNVERDITYAELISDIYKNLPKKRADAVVYRFYHGYSVDSVSSLLHVSKRTLMYWYKKDIPKLAEKLNVNDYR